MSDADGERVAKFDDVAQLEADLALTVTQGGDAVTARTVRIERTRARIAALNTRIGEDESANTKAIMAANSERRRAWDTAMQLMQGETPLVEVFPLLAMAADTSSDLSRNRVDAVTTEARRLAGVQPGDKVIAINPSVGVPTAYVAAGTIGMDFSANRAQVEVVRVGTEQSTQVSARIAPLVKPGRNGQLEPAHGIYIGDAHIAQAAERALTADIQNAAGWIIALHDLRTKLENLGLDTALIEQAERYCYGVVENPYATDRRIIVQAVTAAFCLEGGTSSDAILDLEELIVGGLANLPTTLSTADQSRVRMGLRSKVVTMLKTRHGKEPNEATIDAMVSRLQSMAKLKRASIAGSS